MTFLATSRILTGWPMSRRKVSPPWPISAADSTRCTASVRAMKKRFTSGWVTVTGPPSSTCLRNRGTTLPLELITLPKRTAMNLQALPLTLKMTFSAANLVSPHDADRIDGLVRGDEQKTVQPFSAAALARL